MIAVSNAAADSLLGDGVSVVGEHANDVLPAELARLLANGMPAGMRAVRIGASTYQVSCSNLGATSRGTGTVITLLQGGAA